jgi:hypothetical protein
MTTVAWSVVTAKASPPPTYTKNWYHKYRDSQNVENESVLFSTKRWYHNFLTTSLARAATTDDEPLGGTVTIANLTSSHATNCNHGYTRITLATETACDYTPGFLSP